MAGVEFSKQTVFNGSIAKIERLHYIKLRMHGNRCNAQYPDNPNMWRYQLQLTRSFFQELSNQMSPKKKKDHFETSKKLGDDMDRIIGNYKSKKKVDRNITYDIDEWEISLSEIMQERGLDTTTKEDINDFLDKK